MVTLPIKLNLKQLTRAQLVRLNFYSAWFVTMWLMLPSLKYISSARRLVYCSEDAQTSITRQVFARHRQQPFEANDPLLAVTSFFFFAKRCRP